MHYDLDDFNDSSMSTTTRSVHLPIEKQRSLSEIVRKRNCKYKVEDYKRSFQKFNTFDEQQSEHYQPLPSSKSAHALSHPQPLGFNTNLQETKRLTKTKSFEIPYENSKETDLFMEKSGINIKNFNDSEQKDFNEYVINSNLGVAYNHSLNFFVRN